MKHLNLSTEFYDYAKALAILNENLGTVSNWSQTGATSRIEMGKVQAKVIKAMRELVATFFDLSEGLPTMAKK